MQRDNLTLQSVKIWNLSTFIHHYLKNSQNCKCWNYWYFMQPAFGNRIALTLTHKIYQDGNILKTKDFCSFLFCRIFLRYHNLGLKTVNFKCFYLFILNTFIFTWPYVVDRYAVHVLLSSKGLWCHVLLTMFPNVFRKKTGPKHCRSSTFHNSKN